MLFCMIGSFIYIFHFLPPVCPEIQVLVSGCLCPMPACDRCLSVTGGIYIPNLLFQCLEMLFTELIHPVFTFLNVRIIILSRTHPCRQNLPARDAPPRDFSSLQIKFPRQGCIALGFFIPADKISPPGMHRLGIFHPCRQKLQKSIILFPESTRKQSLISLLFLPIPACTYQSRI